ncbi:DUF4854 domain-containing protein [Scatolibacter rhodanostii]|uniref:DUF4854 domain-containing protein n=1 Tax=Scatolibacter rhodanostii TaxID=2014781 RepID=UPI001180C977|nr:DUF4854 domain-containing protein [Scatolibacter rhodanostii]
MKKILSLLICGLMVTALLSSCKRTLPGESSSSMPPEVAPISEAPIEQEPEVPKEIVPESSAPIIIEPTPETPSSPPPEEIPEEVPSEEPIESSDESNQLILEQVVSFSKENKSYTSSVESLKKLGIEMSVLARDGYLVFSYFLPSIALDDNVSEIFKETARKTAESQIDSKEAFFDKFLDQMSTLGIENPTILCEFLDKNNNVFFEKEIT